jgi:hypothetical protein
MINHSEEQFDIEGIALGVIRGEVPLRALKQLGVEIDSQDESLELRSEKFNVAVTPTVLDVALGLLRYGSSILDREDLRKWAFFLLGESGLVDLVGVESDPEGELLISALWDASFDEGVSRNVLETAARIKRDSGVR